MENSWVTENPVSSWELPGGRALVVAHGEQGIPIAVRKASKGLVESGGTTRTCSDFLENLDKVASPEF